ncbi:MAG: DNA repair protein RecN [Candidatus Omnitrophica bacterium]|nr:DNA repair protein RecN [Candidatus Omnitrophota bacterium]
MLESLTIKNFGIIEHAALDFTKGLNTLTGETGAGKSILIDALRFALGERFQASCLRAGADICTVEAIFALKPEFLKTLPDWNDHQNADHTLIIQRSVSADGRNKAKLNGLAISIAQLKDLGDRLIDFHGPNDHQQLLATDQHLTIIDALTGASAVAKSYIDVFTQYTTLKKELAALQALAQSRERDINLLAHQIKELEQVPLTDEDLAEIERDRVRINNSEKLYTHITQALAILENDEISFGSLLSRAFKPLQHLAEIDEKACSYLDNLSALQENADTLLSDLRDYADSLSFDPGFALSVNSRYDAYIDIKRKYGPTLDDARKFYTEAKVKFALLNDFEQNEEGLLSDLKSKEDNLTKLARTITLQRQKTAELLKKTIEKELKDLAFKSISFKAHIDKAPLSANGADKVVFFISTNTGEEMKPLAEIVSSGEAARLMLAIKRALMKVDPVPVLIFDEVDAQIGGRLGTVIGEKLKEISRHRQVILITHLPQIAAFADTHFKIAKAVEKGRTNTIVSTLKGNERINELAHMMSGDKMSTLSIKHAKDMLKEAQHSENSLAR